MPSQDESSGEAAPLKIKANPSADAEVEADADADLLAVDIDADEDVKNVNPNTNTSTDMDDDKDTPKLDDTFTESPTHTGGHTQKQKQEQEQTHKYDLSPEPVEENFLEDFLDGGQFNDPVSGMTYGRRIARHLSMKWTTKYNPSLQLKPIIVSSASLDFDNAEFGLGMSGEQEVIDPPSLDRSWEFFEHHVLPRCFDEHEHQDLSQTGGKLKFNLAEPGEKDEKTKLYPVWETPLEEMADFGIGVGMYFSMVRYFTIMCFIAGCLNLPNIVFYVSDAYSKGQVGIMNAILAGSAVCTDTKWQPCPSCELDDNNADDRIIQGKSPLDGSDIMFILTNQCDVNERFGIMALVTVFFVTVSMFGFIFVQQRMRVKFDQQELTTADFSIVITNPPYNAKDPDIWKNFFESKFENLHVTLCTVVLENQHLIRKMVKRRKLLAKLKKKLPPNLKFEVGDLEHIVLQCSEPGFVSRMFFGSVGPKEIYDRIKELDMEIEDIAMTDFPVTRVFVTFDTEDMQQRVLQELVYPKLCKGVVDSMYKFDGLTLEVREPDEPSAIRWTDLDQTPKKRFMQRCLSYIITALLITLSAVCIARAHGRNLVSSTAVIILFNVLSPIFVKIISSFESHVNQTSYDTSVYVKITALRWINTVIVTAVETNFSDWIRNGSHLINAIHLLFVAELITRPIVQLSDWMGHLKRHILAPRAKDQRSMNMFFTGPPYSIAEKYTDVTKLLFLTCFYCTIFPAAWFFSAVILAIYFWLDKFSIMRTWKQGPKINSDISRFSNYFFLICAVTLAMSSAYTFAEFPFDNTCVVEDEQVNATYVGEYNNSDGDLIFSITENDMVYKYCDQNMGAFPPMHDFQPPGEEWMNEAQRNLSPVLAWSAVGVLVASTIMLLARLSIRYLVPCFVKAYSPSHDADEMTFSSVLADKYAEIDAYVPQVPNSGIEFPFLICDVTNLENDLIGWRGFDDDFAENNIVFDLPQVMMRNRSTRSLNENRPVFSIVKQWID